MAVKNYFLVKNRTTGRQLFDLNYFSVIFVLRILLLFKGQILCFFEQEKKIIVYCMILRFKRPPVDITLTSQIIWLPNKSSVFHMYFWEDHYIVFIVTGACRAFPLYVSKIMYENWISIIWRRSIPVNSRTWAQSLFVISKPTCDKPKAEGRRPESASEASSIRPEVYSSRSEHLPEAPTCIRPRVHWPEVYSSIREVNWVYVKSRKVEENSRKSPERVQKKSRKSPEKDQNHPRVCFRKV